jgi:hypothetical protein
VILYFRKIVFGLILVFLSEIPFAQISMIIFQNFIMMILYLVLKPYSSGVKNIIMAVTEFGMLMGISIIFFLIEDNHSDPESERVKKGWISVFIFGTIIVIHFIMMVFQSIASFIESC